MLANPTIVSTKKLAFSQKNHLLNAHCSLIEADFISISYQKIQLTAPPDLLVFTSKNALRAVALQDDLQEALQNIPCVCVGEKTKQLAQDQGFEIVSYADYAKDLVPSLNSFREKSVAFFAGNIRRNVLPDFLKENHFDYEEYTVYSTEKTPKKIEGTYEGILFFSPSGVESFLEKNTIQQQMCFCIGTTTAEALKPYTQRIICAKKPTIENTLIRAISYFKEYKNQTML